MDGKVNSKSRFDEIFIENRPIGFTQEVVEKIYEVLPSEQKYIVDEAGNIYKLDPVGVVRSALMRFGYQLETTWSLWGTMAPSRVNTFEKLLIDVTEDLSISIKELSQKLYGNKKQLDQIIIDISRGDLKTSSEVFKILNDIKNLDNNDPRFRAEDLSKLKQEKIPILYLYFTEKIYSGFTSELFKTYYQEIFLRSNNPNEIKMYFEILDSIEARTSDIDLDYKLQGNSFYMSDPNLDSHCISLWGNTYRGLQVKLSQNIQRTNGILRNRLMNIIGFNNKPIDYNSIKDELISIGDIKNSQGSVIKLSGQPISEYDMVYLTLGRQDSIGGTKPNHNYIHLLAGHFESGNLESDFTKIGLKDPNDIVELIFDVVENQMGVEVDSGRHRVVYKLEYQGRIEYLVIGLKADKSIHTAFIADDILNKIYSSDPKYDIFNMIDRYIVYNR